MSDATAIAEATGVQGVSVTDSGTNVTVRFLLDGARCEYTVPSAKYSVEDAIDRIEKDKRNLAGRKAAKKAKTSAGVPRTKH